MAPIAAHLISGIPLKKFGPIFNLNKLQEYKLTYDIDVKKKVIQCSIQYIDSFGNGITNIQLADNRIQNSNFVLHEGSEIRVKIREKLHKGFFTSHFSKVPLESILFLPGSTGFLELSINQGDASEKLGFEIGDILVLKL